MKIFIAMKLDEDGESSVGQGDDAQSAIAVARDKYEEDIGTIGASVKTIVIEMTVAAPTPVECECEIPEKSQKITITVK